VPFLSLLCCSVFAHPGRTNASGCHNDRKNGGYHCHNSGSSARSPGASARSVASSTGSASPSAKSVPEKKSSGSTPQQTGRAISNPAEIKAFLSRIPTEKSFGYSNLAERLPDVGMRVKSIQTAYKGSDTEIRIMTSKPNVAATTRCAIVINPVYLKRGNRYIPQDLTAHWLVTNRCDFREK